MSKIKIVKMNKKGEALKDKDGNIILEEIDIQKLVEKESEKKLQEIAKKEEDSKKEIETAKLEKKDQVKNETTIAELNDKLESIMQSLKGNQNTSAKLENQESDQKKEIQDDGNVLSMGINLQNKKIIGIESEE